MPFRTLVSRSSRVKLFSMKYRSLLSTASPPEWGFDFEGEVGGVEVSFVSSISPSNTGPSDAGAEEEALGWSSTAGIGIPGRSTAPFRSRLTSRTVWNRESWSFDWAAKHDCSSLKFANAQLLLEIKKRESNPGASLQTWLTRLMRSAWGGRLPIQIAYPKAVASVSRLDTAVKALGTDLSALAFGADP